MITVRRAEIKDIPTIMQFMDDHWLHGYILAQDREFFEWQFVRSGKVNIWIGIDDETGKMYAMQSVIFYREIEHPDMSGSVWIAIKSDNPLLAFEVQDTMWAQMQPRDTFSPGLRPDAVKVNKLLGNEVVAMDHYYRLSNAKEYRIAVVRNKLIPYATDTGYILAPCNSLDEMKGIISEEVLISSIPSKDYSYIKWRYFDHPIFKYDLWKIVNPNGSADGILITREEHANGATSCKIVDFYGEFNIIGKLATALDTLMSEKDYEFVDVYSYGVPIEQYEKAGMLRCDNNSENIIPNYFQPYTPVNSDIMLVPPSTPGSRLFRGDSDQDKPRLPIKP